MEYEKIKVNYEDIDGKEYPVTIWLDRPAIEKEKTIMTIVYSIIDEEKKEYYGIFSEIFWKYYIIKLFVDNIDFKDDPTIEDMEKLVTETNLYYIVLQHVDGDITDRIQSEVEKNIEFKTGVKVKTIEDIMIDVLKVIQDKMGNINVDELTTAIAKLAKEVDKNDGGKSNH